MKLKKHLIYCTLLFSFLLNSFVFAENTTTTTTTEVSKEIATESQAETTSQPDSKAPSVVAQSAILIDADTGTVLYEKDPDKKLYPASITKILTSLITLEKCKLDEKVTHSHEAVFGIGPGSSHIGMRENEVITVEQALHGILLASANEVCVAVAEHIGGNVDNFMKMANEKAKQIGAVNTHFTNPHGFHDDNHYTTARDMALIMKEAIKNETFVKIINTYSYQIPPTNIVNETRYLHNSNKLINKYHNLFYEYCVGGKTGFTDQAGNTLVTYCKKDGMNLISVVMKDQGLNIYTDSKNLMEYGFTLFEDKEIFNKSSYTGISNAIQVFHDKKIELAKISVIPKDNLKIQLPKKFDTKKITTKEALNPEINAPIKVGDKVGTLDLVYTDNNKTQVLGTVDLISNTNVEPIPEEVLQEEENMQIFWDNTLKILTIVGIVAGIIVILIILIILVKKYKANKNSLHFK